MMDTLPEMLKLFEIFLKTPSFVMNLLIWRCIKPLKD